MEPEYAGFVDFLTSEYGEASTEQEVAQAIVNWMEGANAGKNPKDFEGIYQYLNDQVLRDAVKFGLKQQDLNDLRMFIKKQRGDL